MHFMENNILNVLTKSHNFLFFIFLFFIVCNTFHLFMSDCTCRLILKRNVINSTHFAHMHIQRISKIYISVKVSWYSTTKLNQIKTYLYEEKKNNKVETVCVRILLFRCFVFVFVREILHFYIKGKERRKKTACNVYITS